MGNGDEYSFEYAELRFMERSPIDSSIYLFELGRTSGQE